MPKIYELDSHVADLIAAGEVVERPASVVKELMENAIDAGAGIITVEIASGGMGYIRVSDNGCGIAPEDAKTAFLRHATSKLRNAEGLEAIGTLGFRGEALAAIAAVSRIELQTRELGASEGVKLLLEAGEVVDFSPVGCPEGTTIIVRDLFFNTPARLKFMKSDRAESSAVASSVLRGALARPDVSIRFIKDGQNEHHTPGDSRVDSCIYSLLGREFSSGLIEAQSSDETVSVTGFVSSPDAARGNRSYQFFFVNGRPIKSLTLQAALEQAYKNLLPSGRFPSCVLYITIRPSNVDVNVHPAKAEVKFASDKQVFDGVYYAALSAITKGAGAIPNKDSEHDLRSSSHTAMANFVREAGTGHSVKSGGFKSMQVEEFRKAYEPKKSPYADKSAQVLDTIRGAIGGATYDKRPLIEIHKNNTTAKSELESDQHTHVMSLDGHISEASTQWVKPRVIGEAFRSYIIVEYENSVWFIDKHAAHERLYFNALKDKDFETMSQALITPIVCRHGFEDVELILENSELFEKLGFEVERFGDDSVAVRRIPSEIDITDTEIVLSEIITLLRLGGNADSVGTDEIYRVIACKAAIKAGMSSGQYELEVLASKVMSGEASHCPHGRPVAFEVSKAELDKKFKRN